MGSLRPYSGMHAGARVTRGRQYEIISRYDLRGQSIGEVLRALNIEKSQFYRERAKALDRVAQRLTESLQIRAPKRVEPAAAFEYRTAAVLQQSGNFELAFEILNRVVRGLIDPIEKAQCLLRLAELHLDVGNVAAAQEYVSLAERCVDGTKSLESACYAKLVRAQIMWAVGRSADARRCIGEILDSLKTRVGLSDPFPRILLCKTVALSATVTFHVSTLTECRNVVDYGCEVSACSGEPGRDVYADLLTVRTSINAATSETLETARADDDALMQFAKSYGLLRKFAVGIKDLAVINQYWGKDSQAKMYAEQALVLSSAVSGAKERAVAVFEWARMYADKCDGAALDASRELIRDIRSRLPLGGYWWGYSFATDSYVALAQSRPEEALCAAGEALSTFRFVRSDRGIGIARSLQSQGLRMLGDTAEDCPARGASGSASRMRSEPVLAGLRAPLPSIVRLACAAIIALPLLGAAGPKPITRAMERRIDAVISSELKRQFVPGAQLAIAENGRVVYAKGYGLRDVGDGLPVDAATSFAIGSVTKQFTAAAIMQLQSEGKLNVDERLAKYLPQAPHASEVTLRELLTHTSGIVGYTEQPNFSLLLPTPTTPDRIIATIASQPLAFAPETRWEYSNTNFVLLGMVVAKVSGESYPDYLRDHVFRPLRLDRMWYTRTEQIHSDDARGYSEFMYGLPDERAYLADWSWYDAAGGITASAADLARWDIALDSGRVVPPAAFAQMTTPFHLKNGKSTGYGFGLGVGSDLGRPTVGHDGLVSGFSAENLTFPKDGVAIVLLANGDNFSYLQPIREVASIIYGAARPRHPFVPAPIDASVVNRARSWLGLFLHGDPVYSEMSPDLVLSLPPYRIAQLVEDGRIVGQPLQFEPASVDRRPPLTIYRFRVQFHSGPAEYVFTVNDKGEVAGFALQAWN